MSALRLKHVCEVIDVRAGSSRPPLLAVSIHRGVVPRDELTDDEPRADDLSTYRLCEPGDIVLNRMRAFQGAIGMAPVRGLVSPDYLVLRPRPQALSRFLHYLFRSTEFVGQMVSRLRGIGSTDTGTVRTPRINPEDLLGIAVRLPPIQEQRAIADYLDLEIARIDALIGAKQRLISLLADKAVAYVAEHPSVSAAPRVKLGRVVRRMEQGWSPQCDARLPDGEEWGVLKVGCVNGGSFSPDELKALPAELTPKDEYVVRDGDLLMSRANNRELVGSAAVVSNVRPRTLLSDKLYRVEVESTALADFIALWLQTREARDVIELEATGASDSMQNIGQDTVRRIPLPLLPLDEQHRFVADCHIAAGRITAAHAAIDKQILLLREHRQALIAAAVGGEVVVRMPA